MPPILKILPLLSVLLFNLGTYAQKPTIQDTVDFKLKTKISKNHRIEISNYLRNLDSVSDPIHRAQIYNEISTTYIKASYYLAISKTDSVHYYSNKALSLTQGKNNTKALQQHLFAINNIGWSYQNAGDYTEALTYFKKTLNHTEHIIDPIDFYSHRQSATTGAALVYESQKNYTLAIEQYTSLLTYVDKNEIDTSNISSIVFIYLARFLGEVHDLDKAFSYANKGLEVATRNKIPDRIALAYLELACLKFKYQEYKEVAFFLSKAFEILKNSESIVLLSKYYLIKSYVAGASGTIAQKIHYAEKAFELNGNQETNRRQVIIGHLLADAYKDVGNYKKAFEYLEKTTVLENILTNREEINKRRIIEIERRESNTAFERTQKELEQAKNLMNSRIITMILLLLAIFFITGVYIFRDRLKKIRLVAIIKQKNEELKELSLAKSRLFTNISHELRTPLTLISGPVDQILDLGKETLDIATTSKLQMVRKNIKSLKILVNDILDLSKLEASKLELTMQSIYLENTLKEITSKFIPLAEKNDIDFTISLEGIKDYKIVTDTQKLEKIINNLLSNAFKHTPSKGFITIEATEKNNRLHIVVQDTGSGISENDLPKIFDRYFQSSDPSKPLQGGSGIGLSLVKELVTLMQGEITVESQVGKGSTFRLTLPITAATEHIEKEEENIQLETISLDHLVLTTAQVQKEHTIMIVEDHFGMQEFITSILDKKYNLIVANNGEEALEKLRNTASVDLIISDVMMPIMDGFTLLETVKQSNTYQDIPMIMLTALVDTDHKLKALTFGVDDYLSKPFDTKELLARTHNLISRYQQRKEVKEEIAMMAHEIQPTTPESPNHVAKAIENSSEHFQNKDDVRLMEQVTQIIESNLENPEFKLRDLTEYVYLEERQLRTKIKIMTGLSPKKFQQEIILLKARKLLENETYGSVKAVAISVGMTHVTRFSRLYEARFGKHPNLYFKDAIFSIKKKHKVPITLLSPSITPVRH
jgi:signal transduction histidine kinase/DNA-binding response OmpR family regulator